MNKLDFYIRASVKNIIAFNVTELNYDVLTYAEYISCAQCSVNIY